MKTKICTKCGIKKPLSEFSKHKAYRGGYRHQCKQCIKIYQKTYQKNWRKNNKKWLKEYNIKIKDKLKKIKKLDWLKNKDKYTNLHTKRCKERYNTDFRFRLIVGLRNKLRSALKMNRKSLSTMFLIGCEIDYLMFHIQEQFQPGMSWDNYGEWHIDHIKPCALFDLSQPSEQYKCFNYTNLQPLWAEENLSKGAKYE